MRNKLTALGIKKADSGKLFDGGGLTLVKKGDSGKWVYRYSHLGKRREMGLGSWPTLSLADARQARDQWASVLASGRDPISIREADAAEAIAQRDRKDPTFSELTDIVFEARRDTLRGGGTRGRWRSPVDLYLIPAFGRRRGSELTARDVADAVRPIWKTKHPTAVKAIRRARIILRSAKRMGFPTDPDIVDMAVEILGAVNHVPKHTPHVPWQEIPALYAALPDTAAGWCNRWCILTATRLMSARGARLAEIDGDIWTVPADRMKGLLGKVEDFRVPLSPPALDIAKRTRDMCQELLFPGLSATRPITDAAVEKCLRKLEIDGKPTIGKPHGFRTSFRTWAQDTGVSFDVAEISLAHSIGNEVTRAYARSDLLERRRVVMDAWARFVTGEEAAQTEPDGKVVSLNRL